MSLISPAPVRVSGNSRLIQFCSSTLSGIRGSSPDSPRMEKTLLTWPTVLKSIPAQLGSIFHVIASSSRAESHMRSIGSRAVWPAEEGAEGVSRGVGEWGSLRKSMTEAEPGPSHFTLSAAWLYLKNQKTRLTSPRETFLGLTSFEQDKSLSSSRKHPL